MYNFYHESYTSAINEAIEFALNDGYELNDEELAQDVGFDSVRPQNGKTTRLSLKLHTNKGLSSERLQVQVYNRGTETKTYELNCYIS